MACSRNTTAGRAGNLPTVSRRKRDTVASLKGISVAPRTWERPSIGAICAPVCCRDVAMMDVPRLKKCQGIVTPRRLRGNSVLPAGRLARASFSCVFFVIACGNKKAARRLLFYFAGIPISVAAQLPQPLDCSELSRRVRQFRLRGRVFQVRTRVLQRFLGMLFRLLGFCFVEVLAADGRIGENGHEPRLDLENPARDEHEFLLAVFRLDAHRARPDPRDEWRMTWQNPEFTRFARQRDELRPAGEDLFFCADDFYLNA